MTPDRWAAVDEILAEALELSGAERDAFVRLKCERYPEFEPEIRALLRVEPSVGSFLETRTIITASEAVTPAAAPGAAGPYRLFEEIGRGGMGAVYRGERDDGQFRKRVAVKVLETSSAASAAWQRFQQERQIMASLEHPNICRLMDAGVAETGVPYLVMEFVEGKSLLASCRELDERARLLLFQKICGAVQYAHQNLIVHRDLKPGNVMISADGEPKLMDFGIANILDDSQAKVASTAFTPGYASPEQIAGGTITTQSDIYSLGVILRELLGPGELHPDLLAIVRQAMQTDPAERYATAVELASDVGRYLSRMPVRARKGGRWYVFGKFVARRKWLLAATTTAALVIIGLGLTAWWQAGLANRRFNDVQRLANSVLYELHDAIAVLPGSTPARKLLVQRSLEYLDRLSADARRDEELLLNVAKGYIRLGRVQGGSQESNLGDPKAAAASFQKARVILDGLQSDRIPVQQTQANLLLVSSRLLPQQEALRLSKRAIEISEALVQRDPNSGNRNDLASAYVTYSDRVGDAGARIEYQRKAAAIYDALLQNDPGNHGLQRNVALARKRLGSALCAQGRKEEGLEQLQIALRLDEVRHRESPLDQDASMDLAITLSEMANYLFRFGDRERPIELAERSTDIRRALWKQDGSNARFAGRLVHALYALAYFEESAGDSAKASKVIREAVQVSDQMAGRLDFPLTAFLSYKMMARLEAKLGRTGCPYTVSAARVYQQLTPQAKASADMPKDASNVLADAARCR